MKYGGLMGVILITTTTKKDLKKDFLGLDVVRLGTFRAGLSNPGFE